MSNIDLSQLKLGLEAVYNTIDGLSKQAAPAEPIALRSLSGDHINGGKITNFESIGIKDNSTKLSLIVSDKGISTRSIKVENILGDVIAKGNVTVEGELTVKKLHVDEITSDIRLERSSPLEFIGTTDADIVGKGLYWKGDSAAKRLIFLNSPNRLWSSEPIDLHNNAAYFIDGLSVLNRETLGNSVKYSSLVTLGTVQNLSTSGNLTVDEYLFYEASTQRIGLGTDTPNGNISIASYDNEFIIDVEGTNTSLGNWTSSTLNIVTDNTPRIVIGALGNITIGTNNETKTNVLGKLGINVKNPDVDIVTAGPVRFQGKKQEVGSGIPTIGVYEKGDIVWNDNPTPTGYVGWICVRSGTPGIWKAFGQISG